MVRCARPVGPAPLVRPGSPPTRLPTFGGLPRGSKRFGYRRGRGPALLTRAGPRHVWTDQRRVAAYGGTVVGYGHRAHGLSVALTIAWQAISVPIGLCDPAATGTRDQACVLSFSASPQPRAAMRVVALAPAGTPLAPAGQPIVGVVPLVDLCPIGRFSRQLRITVETLRFLMGRPQQGGSAVQGIVRRLEICPALTSDIRAGFRRFQGRAGQGGLQPKCLGHQSIGYHFVAAAILSGQFGRARPALRLSTRRGVDHLVWRQSGRRGDGPTARTYTRRR